MKSFLTMLKIELRLSLRGMDMLIFAICMPLLVLILIGIFYGEKEAFPGASFTFLEQSFGAISTIAICAGGVMGLPLVVSDYRNKKILKRFQVTPIRPIKLLSVQVVIYTLYAVVSLLLLYGTASLFFGVKLTGSPLSFLGSYLLVLLSMFSIGMMVGGIAPNEKVASILASILYFPMLIFSGATLPYEAMPPSLQRASDFLPLTQGIKLLKVTSLGLPINSVVVPIGVTALFAVICIGISLKFFQWE